MKVPALDPEPKNSGDLTWSKMKDINNISLLERPSFCRHTLSPNHSRNNQNTDTHRSWQPNELGNCDGSVCLTRMD